MNEKVEAALVNVDELNDFAVRAFAAVGVPRADAEVIADSMIVSHLRGEGDHGLRLVFIWCHKIRQGGTNPLTPIEVIRDKGATALLEANNGIGAVAATRAMNMAIEKAREYGVGWVGVRNANSLGSAKYYSGLAAQHRMIGLCLSNGRPLLVPPGGLTVRTGTNPISIAAPTKSKAPVVLDMACSNAAYERVRIYASQGRSIPKHWAIDPEGNAVEDPSTISEDAFSGGGGLVGIGDGGYKGFGLSVMVNALSGVLNGGAYFDGLGEFAPYNIPERDSFALVALNIENFMPYEQFASRMDDFVETMKSSKLAPGVSETFVPGEKGFRREQERRKSGVPLDEATAEGLRSLARELNIAPVVGL